MRNILLFSLFLCSAAGSLAQCGPCTVGDTCIVDPPLPTVCPVTTPPGTVGVPYSLDVTFWIPPSFPEPTTTLNVVLDQVVVNSFENLPQGLTYEASSPSLTYFPQQDPFGCVRVCGIPLVAGNDTIRLNTTVQGTVGGVGTTRAYALNIPIVIFPASQDTAPDFTAQPDTGCVPHSVSFEPLIAPAGYNTSYAWSFGNGVVFSGANPPDQTYQDPGVYPVSVETTISVAMLTGLSISAVNEDWCGDLDEPDLPFIGCVGQPDLYFTITDSRSALNRSAVASNTQSTTWSGLQIPLAFPPFTLRLYDDDGLSDDDLLGTFLLDNTVGTLSFSSGATSGQRTVLVQEVNTFTYTDSVVVLPAPNSDLVFDMATGVLCAVDQGLLEYTWSLNGDPVPTETGPCVMAENGVWSLGVTNSSGCSSSSSYEVMGLGLAEAPAGGASVSVFPIPNAGTFVVRLINWPKSAIADLSVVDALGRVVHTEKITCTRPIHEVSLGDAAPGSYSLVLSNGATRTSQLFIMAPH